MLGPSIEVVGGGNRSRSTLALPDGPVLREGGGAGDGRLVGASVSAKSVSRTVRGDSSELRNTRGARIEATVAFHNVIFGLGTVDPAVDGKVGAAATR